MNQLYYNQDRVTKIIIEYVIIQQQVQVQIPDAQTREAIAGTAAAADCAAPPRNDRNAGLAGS